MAQVKITLTKSLIGRLDKQQKTAASLGLKKIGDVTVQETSPVLDGKIAKISQEHIQREVNTLALTLSPKTVRNVHGFISAVLAAYRPELALHTVLPKRMPPKIYVPSEAEIQCLMDGVKGTVMELPILLAAFGPMRRGEICALRSENIAGSVVHVCENMVLTKDNEWIVKTPKSYAGDRYIDYPAFVAEKWKDAPSGRLINLHPANITDRFEVILKKADLPHFRFHDLRHYSASIQHALGVPDAYIMERGGWKNDGVLKQVYRHTLEEKTAEMNRKVNGYFENMHQYQGFRPIYCYDREVPQNICYIYSFQDKNLFLLQRFP